MESWKATSYAKINLGLNILERLQNGYHSIETGFVFLEWSDEITMRKSTRTQISFGENDLSHQKDTLIHKALNVLKKEGFALPELEISVRKRIPIGAGLGGGSSNAALTLRMVNKLAELNLSTSDLIQLGAELGSDVPFFILGEASFASGTGTILNPKPIQPEAWIVTVFPGVHSSTKEAYEESEPNPNREYSLLDELEAGVLEEWRYFLENDFEQSVIPKYPVIGDFKDQFYDFGAIYAAMSGSGSSVFGLFEQDFVALSAYEAFLSLGYPANLTRPGFKPDMGIYLLD